jgi:hypothetical protein
VGQVSTGKLGKWEYMTEEKWSLLHSLFSGDLGKPGRRRKARTVFSDGQLAGLERRWEADGAGNL